MALIADLQISGLRAAAAYIRVLSVETRRKYRHVEGTRNEHLINVALYASVEAYEAGEPWIKVDTFVKEYDPSQAVSFGAMYSWLMAVHYPGAVGDSGEQAAVVPPEEVYTEEEVFTAAEIEETPTMWKRVKSLWS